MRLTTAAHAFVASYHTQESAEYARLERELGAEALAALEDVPAAPPRSAWRDWGRLPLVYFLATAATTRIVSDSLGADFAALRDQAAGQFCIEPRGRAGLADCNLSLG